MQSIRNWALTGAFYLGAYSLLICLYVRGRMPDGSLAWALKDWWTGGGFCTAIAAVTGYLLLQLLAGGYMKVPHLWRTGAWAVLLVFLCLGSCAGSVYQRAYALGWIGEGTPVQAQTIGKSTADLGDGDTRYTLEVSAAYSPELRQLPSCCLHGLELEVVVPETVYESHRVGSQISIVELPGLDYPRLHLEESIKNGTRAYLFWFFVFLALSFMSLIWLRPSLVRLSSDPKSG